MLFPQSYGKCQGKTRKTGHGPHSSKLVVIGVVLLLFVLLLYCLYVDVYCTIATE